MAKLTESKIVVALGGTGAVGVAVSPPQPAKNQTMDTAHSWFFIAPPSGVYSVYGTDRIYSGGRRASHSRVIICPSAIC